MLSGAQLTCNPMRIQENEKLQQVDLTPAHMKTGEQRWTGAAGDRRVTAKFF
jgi:hypothetical protein